MWNGIGKIGDGILLIMICGLVYNMHAEWYGSRDK